MPVYTSPPRSRRGPTVALNLARRPLPNTNGLVAGSSASNSASAGSRRLGSPRPVAGDGSRVLNGTEQRGVQSERMIGRGGGGKGCAALNEVGGGGNTKGGSDGLNGSSNATLGIKTRSNMRFEGRVVNGSTVQTSKTRPTPYTKTLSPSDAYPSTVSQTGIRVSVVEGFAFVPDGGPPSTYPQQSSMAGGRLKDVMQTISQQSPTAGPSSSSSLREKKVRSSSSSRPGSDDIEPLKSQKYGDEAPDTRRVRNARPPSEEVYSPYLARSDELQEEGHQVGTIHELEGEDEGEEGFEQDHRDEVGAGERAGMTEGAEEETGGFVEHPASNDQAGASQGYDAEFDWSFNDGSLVDQVLEGGQHEIVSSAKTRWEAVDINDSQAWLEGGKEFARKFAELNQSIVEYGAAATDLFNEVMQDMASYEAAQQRTAKKLESYTQDLQTWGARLTSSTTTGKGE